ncbi:hypothetical protein L0244_39755 [bacterium]|nr:hypothetical protein [bacterium]
MDITDSALVLDYGVWPFKVTYYWDNLEMGKWYNSRCYVCDVSFSFKFDYPIGNLKLMLIERRGNQGNICAPVCSEECRLTYRALVVMAE